MGKKNRIHCRDDKNAKSKTKSTNGKTRNETKTTNKNMLEIMIEFDVNTPKSSNSLGTMKITEKLAYCDMDKFTDSVINRMDFGGNMTKQYSVMVNGQNGSHSDELKKAAIDIMNKKLKKRLIDEQEETIPPDKQDNGLASHVNGTTENMPIESNSNGNAKTAIPQAKASTSGSMIKISEESGQKMQRLESVTTEASTINSDPFSEFSYHSDSSTEHDLMSKYLLDDSIMHNDWVRMFHCLHCQSQLSYLNRFETLKQVYNHWEREHNNLQQPQPFYFYTTEYAACSYCKQIGTYWDLIKHQKNDHPGSTYAIVDIINKGKCALCSYLGTDVRKHFQAHRIYNKNYSSRHIARMTNPLSYTDEGYDTRLILRIHQKHRCLECGLGFDSEMLHRQHFLYSHTKSARSLLKYNAKVFFDNSRHMICGCCCLQIPWNHFLEHISTVTFEFPCEKCSFTYTDLVDLIVHDRTDHCVADSTFLRTSQLSNRLKKYYQSTRIVHGNGLVITRQNILSTRHDDWSIFSDYIDGLVETVRSRLKEMKFYEMDAKPMKGNKMSQTDFLNDTEIDRPKYPMQIAYKHLSNRASARILWEKGYKKKWTQPKPKKKSKSKRKTNEKDDSKSVSTHSTQTGDSTTSV